MFNKVFLAAALIGSTLVNPLPSDDNTPVVRRASVPANDTCMVEDRVSSKRVEVYATKDSMPIDQGCMFVDETVNKVEEKEKNEDKIMGAKMTFTTSALCSASDIMAAMGAASAVDGKKPSSCVDSEQWTLS